jgi:hypothetical protein
MVTAIAPSKSCAAGMRIWLLRHRQLVHQAWPGYLSQLPAGLRAPALPMPGQGLRPPPAASGPKQQACVPMLRNSGSTPPCILWGRGAQNAQPCSGLELAAAVGLVPARGRAPPQRAFVLHEADEVEVHVFIRRWRRRVAHLAGGLQGTRVGGSSVACPAPAPSLRQPAPTGPPLSPPTGARHPAAAASALYSVPAATAALPRAARPHTSPHPAPTPAQQAPRPHPALLPAAAAT